MPLLIDVDGVMSILRFQEKKQAAHKICMVTCYDYPSAKIVAQTQIDAVLVGDSVAMTVHGFPTTLQANMEMMVMHTAAVARGLSKQVLVTDFPFMAHRIDFGTTANHARRLLQAGAHAVKIEGGDEFTLSQIRHLVDSGVPVMGHIGLQPQSVMALGGYKVQGKNEQQAQRLCRMAENLQACGCFSLVLECIPAALAEQISQSLKIPTIGIGAGQATDGQILVWHDLLNYASPISSKFVKKYHDLELGMVTALNEYCQEVEQVIFPGLEHSFL